LGKKVKCKKCGTLFRFPKESPSVVPASAGAPAQDHKKPQVRSRAGDFSPYDIDDPDSSSAGKKVDVPMECTMCGATLAKGQVVCSKCGYNRETRKREGVAQEKEKKKGGMGKLAAALIMLLLAGAAGGGYYYFNFMH
jgi:ribosomal protein L37E